MSDKKFLRLLAAVIAAGTLATAGLVAYTGYSHRHCSILTYISNEKG